MKELIKNANLNSTTVSFSSRVSNPTMCTTECNGQNCTGYLSILQDEGRTHIYPIPAPIVNVSEKIITNNEVSFDIDITMLIATSSKEAPCVTYCGITSLDQFNIKAAFICINYPSVFNNIHTVEPDTLYNEFVFGAKLTITPADSNLPFQAIYVQYGSSIPVPKVNPADIPVTKRGTVIVVQATTDL